MTDRTAFVTGATGFVGVNLVKALKAVGWRVIALHRPTSNLKYPRPLGAMIDASCRWLKAEGLAP